MFATPLLRSLWASLVALVITSIPVAAFADFSISVTLAPPELPVYAQPVSPGDGYIWTPGYWYWADGDYYWVPGTWVMAPAVGLLWTPPYWGWNGASFVFHEGYWGPEVGFYGGINYGYGYFGHGYAGGRWDGDRFFYNRAVSNVDVKVVHNIYNSKVVKVTNVRVSYNGGKGGVQQRPTAKEAAFSHEHHIPPLAAQVQHLHAAHGNSQLWAKANHGKPPVAAQSRPGGSSRSGAVTAQEQEQGHLNPAAARERGDRTGGGAVQHGEPGAVEHGASAQSGKEALARDYRRQQHELVQRHERERQELQQRQQREQEQLAQRQTDRASRQRLAQRQREEARQLAQRQEQEREQLRERRQSVYRQARAYSGQ